MVDSNSLSGDAALFEPYVEQIGDVVENMGDILPEIPDANIKHAGFGKFSVYFVIIATVFVLGLFAYALFELITECRKKRMIQRELFCRAAEDSEDTIDYEHQNGTIDSARLLTDSQVTALNSR